MNPKGPNSSSQPQTKVASQKATTKECEVCGENVSVLEVYSHAERRHATYIVEGLYLGSATSSSNLTELRHLGIKSILNCAFELPNVFPEEFLYKKLLLKDTKEPIRNIFEECFEFIEETFRTGGKVLVHCAMGRSRSVAIVLAYLMSRKKMTLRQAYKFVIAKRPVIAPHAFYFQELVDHDKQLYGNVSMRANELRKYDEYDQYN